MRRWRSTCNVAAYCNLSIQYRKWHLPSVKSNKLIALVIMKITAVANAWRKVERVMGDTRISRKRRTNVLSSCVTPAYVHEFTRDDGTNRETTWEVHVSEKQPGNKNLVN